MVSRGGLSCVGVCTWVGSGCSGATWYAFSGLRLQRIGWACWSTSKVPQWLYPLSVHYVVCGPSRIVRIIRLPRVRVSTRVTRVVRGYRELRCKRVDSALISMIRHKDKHLM